MSAWPELAALIAEKRRREGLSLRDAGKQSGVAFSTFGRIENGATPSFDVGQRIIGWLEGKAPILSTPMTLRDWFAGQALSGMMASTLSDDNCGTVTNVAEMAYTYADALLAERAK